MVKVFNDIVEIDTKFNFNNKNGIKNAIVYTTKGAFLREGAHYHKYTELNNDLTIKTDGIIIDYPNSINYNGGISPLSEKVRSSAFGFNRGVLRKYNTEKGILSIYKTLTRTSEISFGNIFKIELNPN